MASTETGGQARREARPLRDADDLDPLLEQVGSSRVVLIGEATHGTSEFYRWRAELTRRLIAEKGFSFVAVEGDWPDCHTVHCSVVGATGAPEDPREALDAFSRWPTWMWANEEVVAFTRWLRAHNRGLPPQHRVGFHGLDVYSLWDSLRAVLDYLAEHEPEHLSTAREALRCFEPYGESPQSYALASRVVPESCESEVVALLRDMRAADTGPQSGAGALDERFIAAQNAEVVAGAERYYRAMVRGGAESWNVRDSHMVDTLDRLLDQYGARSKAVVWEHNTHVGDARATDMAAAGMVNTGQLARERHADDGVLLVGFATHRGSVIASDNWDGPVRRMPVPQARTGSLEALLHEAGGGEDALFVFPPGQESRNGWSQEVLDHRAIGVIFQLDVERRGNYVPTVPGRRYDALLYCDHTTALHPLHPVEQADTEPEAFPSGD
ncbi:erythromycin esterase family protein [Haloactinomyces albus]|uniref:Erythromycin esterase-like protein n=1 Tax=Haloactinomyces albus TaxID=1352928 RepID=A0AAE3ZJD0_9ACTN|nr:erythromycin esterase family protein [Haloactinomyces albus]MDR7304252.1 erythromycin esterase-like protein [Haloactinomyces albus]